MLESIPLYTLQHSNFFHLLLVGEVKDSHNLSSNGIILGKEMLRQGISGGYYLLLAIPEMGKMGKMDGERFC